jgi:class 3 adenylate cyclase
MVGFMTFSERAGEEAAFTLMRSLSKLMDDAVREYGGVVQRFTGDGLMAVFGAAVAFEDAPLRACRVAPTILRSDTDRGRNCGAPRPPVRSSPFLGIASQVSWLCEHAAIVGCCASGVSYVASHTSACLNA